MKQDPSWSYAQAAWINTVNALGYVIGAMATLAITHRISTTRLFSIGMVDSATFLTATAFTDSFVISLIVRATLAFVGAGALAATLFQSNAKRNGLAYGMGNTGEWPASISGFLKPYARLSQ